MFGIGEQFGMELFQGMEIFVAVAETGSFTRAAEKLRLSKSTVSETVRELETRLGVRLLERTTRKVTPTEAGHLFLARAARAVEEAAAARAEVEALRSEPSGPLRIGAPDTFSDLAIVPALKSFFALYPKIQIELVESPRYVSLVEEGLDLAIRIAPEPAPNLVVRRIGTSQVVVVASPAYLKAAGRPKHPHDIAGHRIIAFGHQRWASEWPLQKGDESIAVPITPSFTTSTGAAMRAAAVEGLGLTALPSWMVTKELGEKKLVMVFDDWKGPERGIYAVYPTNRLTTPKAKLFVDHFARAMKEWQKASQG